MVAIFPCGNNSKCRSLPDIQPDSYTGIYRVPQNLCNYYRYAIGQKVFLTTKLDSYGEKPLFRGSPRNYSVIVMFTALSPQRYVYLVFWLVFIFLHFVTIVPPICRGCGVCRQASDEFTLVANSYR